MSCWGISADVSRFILSNGNGEQPLKLSSPPLRDPQILHNEGFGAFLRKRSSNKRLSRDCTPLVGERAKLPATPRTTFSLRKPGFKCEFKSNFNARRRGYRKNMRPNRELP